MRPTTQTIEAYDDRMTWFQNFRQSSMDPMLPNYGKTNNHVFFNQLAIMLTGCLWIKFHWEKNTLVSLYLACDDDICNWRRNQSMEFWSKDISLMLPPPTFGKREIIANFWLAKSWKIIEFALVRPSPKNPKSRADLITFVISRIT